MKETTSKLGQQIAKSTQALLKETWKFSDNTTILKVIAALLYFMQRGFLSFRHSVSNTDGYIISHIQYYGVDELKVKRTESEENETLVCQEEYIVVDIPFDDPMSSYISIFESLKSARGIFDFLTLHNYARTVFSNIEGPESYLVAFDIAVYDFLSMIGRRSFGEFVQPKEFAELASRLLDVKGKTVFNPYSGMMNYATTLEGYTRYTGIERNSDIWRLGQIRVFLAGLEGKVNCVNEDIARWTEEKYDIIITTPPLGGFLKVGKDNHTMRADGVCLEFFETTTTQQGVLFSYVTPSLLFDGSVSTRRLREEITEKNLLDTIIIFPANMLQPYTSIFLAAVLLKKGRKKDAPVKMVDASRLTLGDKRKAKLDVETLVKWIDEMSSDSCTYVTIEEIRNNDYSWSADRYIGLHSETFPEGYEVVEFGEVVEFVRGERHYGDKKGHLARISSLSSDVADCIRSVDSFEETSELVNATKITEPVILLSTVREPRPTYCVASKDNPIFVQPNIMACRVKDASVSPTYLCLELSKRVVPSVGSFMHRLTRATLFETKVAFPSLGQQRSLTEQNNLYMAASDNLKMTKAKELGLLELIERLKAEYMIEVRNRKHDMKTPMVQLRSTLKLMESMSHRLPEDFSERLNEYIHRQKVALNTLSEIVQHLADEEVFAEPEVLDVDEILSEFVTEENYYSIEYNKDISFEEAGIKSPKVKMGRVDFLRLVNNIIGNAIEHGFTDKEGHYSMIIHTYIIDDLLYIDFQNDGDPLPDEMDKIRYGMRNVKGKDSKGQGTGGYVVKSITEHYGGDYDVYVEAVDVDGAELTNVLVKLPIYRDDE